MATFCDVQIYIIHETSASRFLPEIRPILRSGWALAGIRTLNLIGAKDEQVFMFFMQQLKLFLAFSASSR